jgi:hypothetical protein
MLKPLAGLLLAFLLTSSVSALTKLQTFDNDETDVVLVSQLGPGEWVSQADGIDNSVLGVPLWNPGGWIQPIGTETALDHLDPVGPNFAGLPNGAIKTSQFTGVIIWDLTNWGDVSTASHVTMDVKGSFAGSGGINLHVIGSGGSLWSWGAAATDLAVGANPGDVTEWTTILIPINKPTKRHLVDSLTIDPEDEGSFSDSGFGGTPFPGGGNWGANGGSYASDAAMIAAWDLTMSNVRGIAVRGLTPDSEIDNLGFVLPDVGTPGDFNGDDFVNAADYVIWRDNLGAGDETSLNGNGNGTNGVDSGDYYFWRANFGAPGSGGGAVTSSAVPEPTMLAMAMIAGFFGSIGLQRRR